MEKSRPLPKRFVIYLPEVEAGGGKLQEAVELFLCRRFGGLTSYPATGLFQRESKAIQREKVQVMECYGERETWPDDRLLLYGLAAVLANVMDQEAIACSVDGRMHHITPGPTGITVDDLENGDPEALALLLLEAAAAMDVDLPEE